MSTLEMFVTFVGLLMSVSYFPQAWRMYKIKSAHAVSTLSFSVLAVGNTTWTAYWFYLNNWTIIASFLLGAVGAWLVLILIWIYRQH